LFGIITPRTFVIFHATIFYYLWWLKWYFTHFFFNNLTALKFKSKQELREAIWTYMEENDLVTFPRPCYGRIPNFTGTEKATEILKSLPEWRRASVIFSAPDSSLHPARREALKEGKTLLVAAPKIKGFYLLKDISPWRASEASSIKGFSKFGRSVKIGSDLPKIDLYLTGAVAVDRRGNRIGKGSGYGDREDEILSEAGLMDEKTPRIALVHEVQVFEDFSFLMEEGDKRVTLIVTPQGVYKANFYTS
jgi:5-formyltetrahydrofolate cyclo-ligase